MAGKWRALASLSSRAQKTLTTLSVAWTTGSDRSPPGGLTAPMTLRAPARRSRPRQTTRPARS